MKWFFAFVVTLFLLCPFGLPASRADAISGPFLPKKDVQDEPAARDYGEVVYYVAWIAVAVTSAGSLAALRRIRKRHGQ